MYPACIFYVSSMYLPCIFIFMETLVLQINTFKNMYLFLFIMQFDEIQCKIQHANRKMTPLSGLKQL